MSKRFSPQIWDHLLCFMRNGRWGTCSGCPRDNDGHVYPEFCTNRGDDHRLDWHALDFQVRRELDVKGVYDC